MAVVVMWRWLITRQRTGVRELLFDCQDGSGAEGVGERRAEVAVEESCCVVCKVELYGR